MACPASRTRHRSIRPRTVGSCSAHRMVVPVRASSSSRSATEAVPAGSSWAVGSSRTRTLVPIATMLAMATRCCSPPDSANGSRSARWPIARRASVASIRASISSRGMPRFSRPNASSSRTVCFEADSWLAGVAKTIPTWPRSDAGRGGRRVDAFDLDPTVELGPDDARDEPSGGQGKGGLPAPVRPATPMRSPRPNVRSIPSRLCSRRPGYRTPRPSIRSGVGDGDAVRSSTALRLQRLGRHGRMIPSPKSTTATAPASTSSRSHRSIGGSATTRYAVRPGRAPKPRASSANVRSRTSTSEPSKTGATRGTSLRNRRDE